MILTVIDPALLVYDFEDLDAGRSCCIERLDALTNHREVIKKYSLRIAVSASFVDFILSLFPWRQSGNNMLRDLREFTLFDLQKAYYVDTDEDVELEISPEGILCQHVECQNLVDAWHQTLVGCINAANSNQFTPNIATWACPSIVPLIELIIVVPIAVQTDKARHGYSVPLVWDNESWASQLVNEDWWPDLHLMVELTFITNTAIRKHPHTRAKPIDFDCSDRFWQSANSFCCEDCTRRSLVKALTKLIYGLRDKGLGWEPVKGRSGIYRFKVTRSARVHCHMEGEKVIIDEIGPHGIDGIG